jgi:hypothetical protein
VQYLVLQRHQHQNAVQTERLEDDDNDNDDDDDDDNNNNNNMPKEQKGCSRRSNGCKDHLLISTAILQECKRRKKNCMYGKDGLSASY